MDGCDNWTSGRGSGIQEGSFPICYLQQTVHWDFICVPEQYTHLFQANLVHFRWAEAEALVV